MSREGQMRHDDVLRAVAAARGAQLMVCCAEPALAPSEGLAVAVGRCIAAEPSCVVPELLAAGASSVVLDPRCADPGHAARSEWLRGLVGDLIAETPGEPGIVAEPLRFSPGLGRRALFGLTPTAPDEQRLAAAMAALEPRLEAPEPVRGAVLAITGSCTACGACVRACPEEALTLGSTADALTLWHHRQRCSSAGACVRICPEQALTRVGVADEPDSVGLATVPAMTCSRCGARTLRHRSGMCRVCADTVAAPFRVRLPPGRGRRGSSPV